MGIQLLIVDDERMVRKGIEKLSLEEIWNQMFVYSGG